jgi:lipoprotein Spr
MRHVVSFIFLVLSILWSCFPSARFSASKDNDYKEAHQDQKSEKENTILFDLVKQWMNTPYKYGGMSKSGVDCSGFSSIIMHEVYNITIPRTAEEQYYMGEKIRDSWLSPGDLVFFKNFRGHGIDHVGIFLGNNRFAHATESNGVMVSDLDEDYYQKRYVGACRYLK